MSLVGWLYRAARVAADVKALSSGNRKRVTRRVRNKAKGRLLARLGFWSKLWK